MPPYRHNPPPRSLTAQDIHDFDQAASLRPSSSRGTAAQARTKFLHYMDRVYFLRMRRIRSDMAWLRKHAAQHGVDPMEVPWLL